MNTKIPQTTAVLTAILLSLNIAAQVGADTKKPKPTPGLNDGIKGESTDYTHRNWRKRQSDSTKPKRIDSGLKLQSMQLHDGVNLVHSGDGVKLMAQSSNDKVIRWIATDEAGNKLPTKVQEQATPTGRAALVTVLDNVHHINRQIIVTKDAKDPGKVRISDLHVTKYSDKASP